MVSLSSRGSWSNTLHFLKKASNLRIRHILEKYGKMGVEALQSATPVRTGQTASSWTYEVSGDGEHWEINWSNTNTNKGVNIAYIIQMGHGTGTGGYVRGIDYINPAMQPIFEQIGEEAFREVISS